MRLALRQHAGALAGTVAGLLAMAWLGLTGFAWTDYDYETAPAYAALVGGHVGRFLELTPAYGGSLVLRAPFALAPGIWGGGELAVYRAVALPCLLATGALALWLAGRMRSSGRSRLAIGVAVGLCVAQPAAEIALEVGHPEELLGAVLCVGAVLAAARGRTTWAALLLGLAVGNKAWALVAVGPVLLALRHDRRRVLAIATVVAAALALPSVAARAHATPAVGAQSAPSAVATTAFQPAQAWWFLGARGHVVRGADGNVKPGYRASVPWVHAIAHPLIVVVAAALALAFALQRRRRGPYAELLLLALVLHLRCLLDPWNTLYYAVPALLALLAWEALARRGAPVLTLCCTVVLWGVFRTLPAHGAAPDAQAAAYLAVAVPAALALAAALFAPATRPAREPAGAAPATA